jgi:hypothetical protein
MWYDLQYIKTHKISIRHYDDTSKGAYFTITVDQIHFNVYYEQPTRNRILAVCLNFLRNLIQNEIQYNLSITTHLFSFTLCSLYIQVSAAIGPSLDITNKNIYTKLLCWYVNKKLNQE